MLEKTLESPLDCKEIQPVHPKGDQLFMEGLMLKLKLKYFGHLMGRVDSLEETLMVGRIEVRRRRGRGWDGWMASPTQWTWVWVSSRSWWWTGKPVHGVAKSQIWLSNRTELNSIKVTGTADELRVWWKVYIIQNISSRTRKHFKWKRKNSIQDPQSFNLDCTFKKLTFIPKGGN